MKNTRCPERERRIEAIRARLGQLELPAEIVVEDRTFLFSHLRYSSDIAIKMLPTGTFTHCADLDEAARRIAEFAGI